MKSYVKAEPWYNTKTLVTLLWNNIILFLLQIYNVMM